MFFKVTSSNFSWSKNLSKKWWIIFLKKSDKFRRIMTNSINNLIKIYVTFVDNTYLNFSRYVIELFLIIKPSMDLELMIIASIFIDKKLKV